MIKGFSPQAPLLFPLKKLWPLLSCPSTGILETWVPRFFGSSAGFFLSSGRAGLLLILEALKAAGGAKKTGVIIPAYTCPTVPYTIEKAGLRVLLCEIDAKGFSFQPAHLKKLLGPDVLAVIPTHLFGIPCDLAEMRAILAGRDVCVIEDFSHAIGSRYKNQRVGTFGDASFASLGRGKLLTTSEGGLVLSTSEAISQGLKKSVSSLKHAGRLQQCGVLARLFLLHAVIAGNRWGLVLNSPYDPERKEPKLDFSVFSSSSFQQALLKKSLEEMDAFNRQRVERAAYLRKGLSSMPGIFLPGIPTDAEPVFMAFPVFFEDVSRLESVYKNLRKRKIGVTRMYKSALNIILKGRYGNPDDPLPMAESLAEKMLLLPCHPYMPYEAMDRIIEVIMGKG